LKSSNVENCDVTHRKVAKFYSHKLKLKCKKWTNEIKSVILTYISSEDMIGGPATKHL
jgi:hypothetical protein